MASFAQGDYGYSTSSSLGSNEVIVSARDLTKTKYEDIPEVVTYNGVDYNVVSMNSCFSNCVNMVTSPNIPTTVTNLHSCFYRCLSLTTPPVIPDSVINMSECFMGCASLTTAPVIPSNVEQLAQCFKSCSNLSGDIYVYANPSQQWLAPTYCLNGLQNSVVIHAMNDNIEKCRSIARTAPTAYPAYVNVHPETPITFTDTEMNYKTDSGFTPMSLQTNANLVQCEVPDLVNGGTITTNVNDALLDLSKRDAYTINWNLPYISDGFTVTRTGYDITIVGTSPSKYPAIMTLRLYTYKPFAPNNNQYQIVGVPDDWSIRYKINNGNIRTAYSGTTNIGALQNGDEVTISLPLPWGRTYNDTFSVLVEQVGGGS